jgi:hypothetical protein
LLLALVGLWPLLRTDRFFLFWLTLSIAVPVYVISSWWNWWYGMSFGHRAFIDYYPLFFISIALGFQYIRSKLFLHFLVFIAVMSMGLNQIYMKQYRDYIFYWQMDKDMFWRVFLHTSRPYAGLFWEEEKLQQTLITLNDKFPVQKSIIKMGYEDPEEQANVQLAKGIAHTGIFSAKLGSEQMYATILNMTVPDSLTSQELAILSSVFMQPLENPIKQELYFILEVWRDGQIVQRLEATTRTHNQFTHQWNRLLVVQQYGFSFLPGDSFLVYLYNPFKNTVYWDDFSLFLYARE